MFFFKLWRVHLSLCLTRSLIFRVLPEWVRQCGRGALGDELGLRPELAEQCKTNLSVLSPSSRPWPGVGAALAASRPWR